jgi:serine/threonine-protein kinase
LRAYGQGRLPVQRLEEIAGHIDVCQRCESSLRDLRDDSDTLAYNLRRYLAADPVAARPAARPVDDQAATVPGRAETSSGSPGGPAGRPGAAVVRAFGQYELLEELGRGGMGVVYKARQVSLNRDVALKMIRAGAYAGPEEQARFRVEAEAVARLKHPNVVPIYDFDEEDGQPYFSMEFEAGGSLAKKLAGRQLPEREAAELVRVLAGAVHAAHRQHIVHRDLKPGNVLLAEDGTPKVSDFGLAKLLDTEGGQTLSDAVMGTPGYMAPEQARGDSTATGTAADVYALGAILYEALTGRPPFRAATRAVTLELVKSAEVRPPSALRPGLSRDLEAVCLKCLKKESGGRYPSAEALADDLARWLRGEPTEARPLRWPGRITLALRRHARVTALAAAGVALTVAAMVVLHPADPDRELRDIERRLARGEAVTLIGETGAPRWSSWRVGGAEAQTSLEADGTFTVHAWRFGLLELVRDPGRARYRFRAEVRHLRCDIGLSHVGIFCTHREDATVAGPVHRFTHLAFNDILDERDLHAEATKKSPQPLPPPAGNTVSLFYRLYRRGGPDTRWDRVIDSRDAELFQPAGPVGGPWRILNIRVTPERIEARWGDEERVGELLSAELPVKALQQLKLMRKLRPLDHSLDAMDPAVFSRGSLGLSVYNGSASFRNVTIEPLGEAD